MTDVPFHTVRQGETLIELALANGLESWRDVLDAPENAELAKTRTDPGILKEGDRVFVPNRTLAQTPAAIDARHEFKVPGPKAWVRIAVKDAEGAPLAGAAYELTLEGKTTAGTVPPDGVIEQPAPVGARSGSLVVQAPAEDPEAWPAWELKVGWMDPLAELSGVQARLENLGFPCGGVTGEASPETEAAIRAFQERVGLEATGEADDALREKLAAYYDPGADETGQEVEVETDPEGASAA